MEIMKALVGIRKHLCVILVVQPQTQERHRDAKPFGFIMENWGKASRICFTLEKEKRLRNRPAPTLNLLVNPSNSGL
ncbi:hypothetical protein ERS070201_01317, partial [Streptococcus pneumoniae]